MYQVRSLFVRCGAAFAVVLALVSLSTNPSMAQGRDEPGAVYVLSNQSPNSILVYARAANGTLSFSGSFLTGGTGAGTGVDPLGSQGSDGPPLAAARSRILWQHSAGQRRSQWKFSVRGERKRKHPGLHFRSHQRT